MKKVWLFVCISIFLLLCLPSCDARESAGTTAATKQPVPETTTKDDDAPQAPDVAEKSQELVELEAFIADYLGADAYELKQIYWGQACNCEVQPMHISIEVHGCKTVDGVTTESVISRAATQDFSEHLTEFFPIVDAENGTIAPGAAVLVRAFIQYGEVPKYHVD